MKRLRMANPSKNEEGLIVEYYDEKCGTRNYHTNEYGVYLVDDEFDEYLTKKEFFDVTSQKDLAARIRRLHYYLKKAEFLSFGIVEILNLNGEDIEKVLPKVVIWDF